MTKKNPYSLISNQHLSHNLWLILEPNMNSLQRKKETDFCTLKQLGQTIFRNQDLVGQLGRVIFFISRSGFL
nr:hypothetical protein CFP56_52618 [Quercus suber]